MRLILLFIALIHSVVFSQTEQKTWSAKPFSNLGFIENNNRFQPIYSDTISFYAVSGNTTYLLTKKGIIVEQKEQLSGNEHKERHEKIEHGQQLNPIKLNRFYLNWQNTNSAAKFLATDQNLHTFHFQDQADLTKTIKANTFKKLICSSIYPGIDLEFSLPEEGGLKYAFVVHPNADPEQIKFNFTDAHAEINAHGQLDLISEVEHFRDESPSAWTDDLNDVQVKFKGDQSTNFSFLLDDYDITKFLVIDPWLVPALPFIDTQQGYELGADYEGNVSVLGQHGNQIAHYNNTGTLEWVWTSPGELNTFYGGMDVNPHNGDTYYMFMSLFLGIQDVWRLDVGGVVTASIYLVPAEEDPNELWRLSYNRVTNQVVIGAGGLPRESHLIVINGDLTTKNVYSALPPVPPNLTDATLLEIDPKGEYFYFLCSGDQIPLYDNTLYKVSQADPGTIIWSAATTHTFQEISCIGYMGYEIMTGEGPDWYSANGMNGIACSYDLYTYDGDSVHRWDKLTGDLLGVKSITPLDPGAYGDLVYCGGIDTDPCGNVYLGTEDSLLKFTRDLSYIEGYELPDTCYEVRFTQDALFASGKNFVQAWDDYDWVDLTLSSTVQPCGSCEGTATIYPESFCPELVPSVVWSPSGQTSFTATGLCIGWHKATVSWINDIGDTLILIDSVEVILGAAGTLNLDITDQSCNDDCDGGVTISVTGGFDPFVFELGAESNATGIFSPLCEGTYPILVTDNDGCLFVDTVTINKLDSINVTETIFHEACADACNGKVILTPTTGLAPYTYYFGAESNGTGIFEDLCDGIYDVVVIDANACAYISTIEIIVGDDLGLDTISANTPTCFGFTDGSATVGTAMGDEPINYTWVPTNPIPGATFNNLGKGTYEVYAIDASGCKDTLIFELEGPDSLYAEITTVDPLCFGDSTGYAVVNSVYNPQGDVGNISFIWTPDPAGINGILADSSYNLSSRTYTVSITDDYGCSWVQDFSITSPDPILFSEFGYDPAYCRLFNYQSGNGVVFAAATGGTPDYEYEWMNMESLTTTDNSTWGGLNPGTYQITVIDNNGCKLIETLVLDSLNPIADFLINSAQLDGSYEGTELVMANFVNQSLNFSNPNNPLADTTFFWNLDHPTANWILSHDYFEEMDTNYTGESTYEICLVAINSNGCTDTLCKTIIVHVQPEFIAPNIFTPDADGINDVFTFEFKSAGIERFSCVIVNRWGVVVAVLNAITEQWDGTDLQGNDCTPGVYFYSYKAESTNQSIFEGQGSVQLIKK